MQNIIKHIQTMVDIMTSQASCLFETDVNSDELWNVYMDSFPEGTNEIFRERRKYECNACRNFIRRFGHVVAIQDGRVMSIWDEAGQLPTPFKEVAGAMSAYIHSRPIRDVYYAEHKNVGIPYNFEDADPPIRWNHLHAVLPASLVCRDSNGEAAYQAERRDRRNVFKRSLEEIAPVSVDTVLELIAQNTLYRGEEWEYALKEFKRLQQAYSALTSEKARELFAWEKGVSLDPAIAKIRNHSIGTLLIDLSNLEDVDVALRKYEKVVAPANYKRPKPVFTAKMIEEAKKLIEQLGYMDSLPRRHAVADDISVNNILFSNRDTQKRLKDAFDVFATMKAEVAISPKELTRVEEISIDDFVSRVLPTARELEVYLEGRHAANMMSLTAPVHADAPSMFKWENGFGWAYSGNIADSDIKQNVAKAGGRVDGVLRFSIQWNDGQDWDKNDLDAHCQCPAGHIYFGNKRVSDGGNLDIDIINPAQNTPAVENITWPELRRMAPGKYQFYVHCYSNRSGRSGFRAEIAFGGETYSFDYPRELRGGENVAVADVLLDRFGNFTVEFHLQPVGMISKDIWNLKTNTFIPVSMVMYSPNYWDAQTGNGNRHYFFMLKDCINPEEPNGFYNEFLKNELLEHKRVLEGLGGRMKIESVPDQLSGVGFASTKRAELVVRVTGATRRMLRIKF